MTALWLLLLVLAVALLLAQALMLRRLRRQRAEGRYPEEQLVPGGVLRILDTPLGKPLGISTWPRGRVVLATRDRRFRRVAQFLLTRQGYTVELSRDADAAVALAEQSGADVVVVDGSDSRLSAAHVLRRLAEGPRPVAAVVVSDAEEEAPQTLPILPKWGAFDSIVEAIESAHAGATRA